MYGGQLGHLDQFILFFFIKHNNWSTLWYDVHFSTEQYILLVEALITGLICDNLSSDTHIIYKLKSDAWETFFLFFLFFS